MTQIRMPRLLLYVAGMSLGAVLVAAPTQHFIWWLLFGDPMKFEALITAPVGCLIVFLVKRRARSLGITKCVWDKTGPHLADDKC